MATTEEDELRAEYKALTDAYAASAAAVAADPTDRMAKLRRRQLAEQIDVMRTHWRNIGAFVGDRQIDAKTGKPGIGVKVTNNDGSVPS